MTFDNARFRELTDDIGRYLGYLKGNELVKEYTIAQMVDLEDQLSGDPNGYAYTFPASLYTSTPEDSQFACDFAGLSIQAPFDGSEATPENREYLRQIGSAMEQSWNNGVAWADGMGAQLREICASFTRAEPTRLLDIATTLQNLADTKLSGLLPEDFVASSDHVEGTEDRMFGSPLGGWFGTAANRFKTFYTTLADRGYRYGVAVGFASAYTSGAAGVIATAQTGLLDFLETTRDGIALQLEEWVATHGNPQDWPTPQDWGWIGDVANVAVDVAGLIPVLDKLKNVPEVVDGIADTISKVNTVTTTVSGYVGGDVEKRHARTDFNVETAESIYTAVTTVLYDEILKEVTEGLDKLAEKSTLAVDLLTELKQGGDWLPYDVGGDTFSVPWTHWTDLSEPN